MTLTTSLALLAVATTIVDGLALYVMQGHGKFDRIKYQDVRLVGAVVGRVGKEGEGERDEEAPLLGLYLNSPSSSFVVN